MLINHLCIFFGDVFVKSLWLSFLIGSFVFLLLNFEVFFFFFCIFWSIVFYLMCLLQICKKEYVKVVHCHPTYLTYMQSTSWETLGWRKHKIAGRNVNNLRYADDITLMAESEELKSLWMKVKEESENVGLKLNIQLCKV